MSHNDLMLVPSFSLARFLNFHVSLGLAFGISLVAQAGTNNLEDELFGSDAKTQTGLPQPTRPPESGPATTSLPKTNTTLGTVENGRRSGVTNEQLTLGGRLELQSSLLKQKSQSVGDSLFSQATTAELYLDSRPTDDLRGFIKGAITNTGGTQKTSGGVLYESWIKWGGHGSVFTTLGKQKLKWGSATFWNPTDFFAVTAKDPFADYDVRPGANLLKIHVPFEKSGHNFYVLANFDDSSRINGSKSAARAELNYGLGNFSGEVALTFAGGRNLPRQWGLDLNTALGPIDIIVESALTHKSQNDFFRVATSSNGTKTILTESRTNEVIGQVVAGLRYDVKYSESDSANVTVEYFWNDFGTSNPVIEAISLLRGQSQRLYLSNRYWAASVFLPQPGEWNDTSLLFSGLWNLADKSWLARASWNEKINVKSNVNFAIARFGGLGEFTGGIPTSISSQLKNPALDPAFSERLKVFEGVNQEWLFSVTAGIEI